VYVHIVYFAVKCSKKHNYKKYRDKTFVQYCAVYLQYFVLMCSNMSQQQEQLLINVT